MNTTTYARRPLTHILVPLLLVGTVGSLGVIPGEAASPRHLSATPAASHTAHTGATSAGHGVRLTVSSGTSADYRAREQLTFFSFPTDAVGCTGNFSRYWRVTRFQAQAKSGTRSGSVLPGMLPIEAGQIEQSAR